MLKRTLKRKLVFGAIVGTSVIFGALCLAGFVLSFAFMTTFPWLVGTSTLALLAGCCYFGSMPDWLHTIMEPLTNSSGIDDALFYDLVKKATQGDESAQKNLTALIYMDELDKHQKSYANYQFRSLQETSFGKRVRALLFPKPHGHEQKTLLESPPTDALTSEIDLGHFYLNQHPNPNNARSHKAEALLSKHAPTEPEAAYLLAKHQFQQNPVPGDAMDHAMSAAQAGYVPAMLLVAQNVNSSVEQAIWYRKIYTQSSDSKFSANTFFIDKTSYEDVKTRLTELSNDDNDEARYHALIALGETSQLWETNPYATYRLITADDALPKPYKDALIAQADKHVLKPGAANETDTNADTARFLLHRTKTLFKGGNDINAAESELDNMQTTDYELAFEHLDTLAHMMPSLSDSPIKSTAQIKLHKQYVNQLIQQYVLLTGSGAQPDEAVLTSLKHGILTHFLEIKDKQIFSRDLEVFFSDLLADANFYPNNPGLRHAVMSHLLIHANKRTTESRERLLHHVANAIHAQVNPKKDLFWSPNENLGLIADYMNISRDNDGNLPATHVLYYDELLDAAIAQREAIKDALNEYKALLAKQEQKASKVIAKLDKYSSTSAAKAAHDEYLANIRLRTQQTIDQLQARYNRLEELTFNPKFLRTNCEKLLADVGVMTALKTKLNVQHIIIAEDCLSYLTGDRKLDVLNDVYQKMNDCISIDDNKMASESQHEPLPATLTCSTAEINLVAGLKKQITDCISEQVERHEQGGHHRFMLWRKESLSALQKLQASINMADTSQQIHDHLIDYFNHSNVKHSKNAPMSRLLEAVSNFYEFNVTVKQKTNFIENKTEVCNRMEALR